MHESVLGLQSTKVNIYGVYRTREPISFLNFGFDETIENVGDETTSSISSAAARSNCFILPPSRSCRAMTFVQIVVAAVAHPDAGSRLPFPPGPRRS